MKHKRFSEEKINGVLKEHEAGAKVDEICPRHGISSVTFYTWRKKFGGMEASDAKRLLPLEAENAKLKRIVAAMKELLDRRRTRPPTGRHRRWPRRLRRWKAHGLAPHRWRTFKLSRDPEFAKKLYDVAGLYVNPPAHAVVLSVDEKSQIQALERTQPGLPIKAGRLGTMTHDTGATARRRCSRR